MSGKEIKTGDAEKARICMSEAIVESWFIESMKDEVVKVEKSSRFWLGGAGCTSNNT